jgi:hypothetical protein
VEARSVGSDGGVLAIYCQAVGRAQRSSAGSQTTALDILNLGAAGRS